MGERIGYRYTFKILLLGDAAVGKRFLMHRFAHGKFNNKKFMGNIAYPYSRYETLDGKKITYLFCNIIALDRFKLIRRMIYRGAMGALVIFDLTREETFNNVNNWVKEALSESPNLYIILVGNKNDLVDDRVITREQGEAKAKEIGAILYIETSAFTGDNMGEAFRTLGKLLLDKRIRIK